MRARSRSLTHPLLASHPAPRRGVRIGIKPGGIPTSTSRKTAGRIHGVGTLRYLPRRAFKRRLGGYRDTQVQPSEITGTIAGLRSRAFMA